MRILLWACSDEGGDKDACSMLGEIAPLFKRIFITEPPGPRAPVTVEQWLGWPLAEGITVRKNWEQALEKALESVPAGGLLCVAGSLYLVGAVRERLLVTRCSPQNPS